MTSADLPTTVSEWEHPDWGIVRVFYRWETTNGLSWYKVSVAVEFDLFTPDSEVAAMALDLRSRNESARVDRSLACAPPRTEDGAAPTNELFPF